MEYTQLIGLAQVVMIDLLLAGDNAIVVGMAASRVAPEIRTKVIFWGIAGAVVLRIGFAAIATQLLAVVGLALVGGLLLLWVCWKMYREIRHSKDEAEGEAVLEGQETPAHPVSFMSALTQIVVADVSMSLDNVLAVAGAAKGDMVVLVAGLAIAISFMALASSVIAKLLVRWPWIQWIGLLIILYIALEMIWHGSQQVLASL